MPERGQLITIDFDCLIRLWDLVEGQCLRSYPLEVLDSGEHKEGGPLQEGVAFHNGVLAQTIRRVQFAKLEPKKRLVFVALEGGYLQVNNIYSGAIVFNKSVEDQVRLDKEISDILFAMDSVRAMFPLLPSLQQVSDPAVVQAIGEGGYRDCMDPVAVHLA